MRCDLNWLFPGSDTATKVVEEDGQLQKISMCLDGKFYGLDSLNSVVVTCITLFVWLCSVVHNLRPFNSLQCVSRFVWPEYIIDEITKSINVVVLNDY